MKLLETQVGGADALQAPAYWDDIVDPTVVQLHELKTSDQEYQNIVRAFTSTLKPPRFHKTVKVASVQRIQNLAMWQSYVVKRQTICYRETGGQDAPQEMKRALDRFERKPLWQKVRVSIVLSCACVCLIKVSVELGALFDLVYLSLTAFATHMY